MTSTSTVPFDVARVREDFPILQTQAHGKPLIYLDNAATSQKPQVVLDALRNYYEETNANIHRGVHYLSEKATREYEEARVRIKNFINARDAKEIIYVRGCTEGINLVANCYGQFIGRGDEIILTEMEHHSNIVPWQMLAQRVGAVIRVIPVTDEGELRMDEYARLLNEKTKFVSVVHISNSLGTLNPVKQIIEMAHAVGAKVLVDGAQSVPHLRVDVQELGCDFYVFSGHKLFGPTGIGVLWGREELLDQMPPYQGGGDMISRVSFSGTTYNALPFKFEAGTPHVEGAIGLAVAMDYVDSIGMENIAAHEHDLLTYATQRVEEIEGFRIVGTAPEKASILAFEVDGLHPTDIGQLLDARGIAIRTGHHCTQPLMDRFGVSATARASFAFYNTREEVDAFVNGTKAAIKLLK